MNCDDGRDALGSADTVGDRAPNSRLLLLLAAITIAGAALRFATLSQSLWFDEAVTVRDVSGNFAHVWGSVVHHELSPPLYFICLWLWRHLFGDSVETMRTMSAVAGTLVIPVAFATANRLVGRRVAIIVALLAASSPVMLYYSQELRSYGLLVLVCSLGLLAFVATLRAPDRRKLALWALVSSLALATHYFAAVAVLPQAAVLAATAWRRRTRRLPVGISVGIVGSVFSALCGLLHYQYARSYHFVLAQVSSAFVSVHFDARTAASGNVHLGEDLFIGPGGRWKELTTLAMLAFFLFALANLWKHPKDARRRGGEFALLLFLPGIAAALLFQAFDLPAQGRYLLVLWLPLTIVVGCGLSMARARAVRIAALSSYCVLSLWIGITTATVPRFSGREDTRGPALSLGAASTPRLIAIDQQWDVLPLELYRPQARVFNGAFATVSELDVVAMPARGFPTDTDANRPLPPRIPGLPKQMILREVIRGATYVIERYTAFAPVKLPVAPSGKLFASKWRFLVEPAGARPGEP